MIPDENEKGSKFQVFIAWIGQFEKITKTYCACGNITEFIPPKFVRHPQQAADASRHQPGGAQPPLTMHCSHMVPRPPCGSQKPTSRASFF
eukprot:828045-Amphidinium_carterae.1